MVLDQRDYPVYQRIRRYLPLLNYDASPNMGNCIDRLLRWPVEFLPNEIDSMLFERELTLDRVASATVRGRSNMVAAAQVHPDVIERVLKQVTYRQTELVTYLHELVYTTRICSELAKLYYAPLYMILTDMVDPALTTEARTACRNVCHRLQRHFAAAQSAVSVFGDSAAQSTINRFMTAKDAAVNNFPATLPAPSAVSAIAAALGNVATDISQLRDVITHLPDAIAGALTLGSLTGSSDDDKARQLVSALHSQNTLAVLPYSVKLQILAALLDGWTVDDDEIAILRVLESAKAHDQAELYQLAAGATWEALYTSVDGDEYDHLESILDRPI